MADKSPSAASSETEQPQPMSTPCCHKCKTTNVSLSRCQRCDTKYCSRSCQALDWKAHKKTCARNRGPSSTSANNMSSSSTSSSAGAVPGLQHHIANPFTRIDNGTYLHDRPEGDVYKLLIDAYRLRMDDVSKFEGIREADSLYAAGVTDALPGFRRFLDRVKAKRGVLPSWWDAEKEQACEQLGAAGGGDGWSSLRRKLDKAAVLAHYRDDKFPMQLRIFVETICGRGVAGQDGTRMRKMLMQQEVGRGPHYTTVIDTSGLYQ